MKINVVSYKVIECWPQHKIYEFIFFLIKVLFVNFKELSCLQASPKSVGLFQKIFFKKPELSKR